MALPGIPGRPLEPSNLDLELVRRSKMPRDHHRLPRIPEMLTRPSQDCTYERTAAAFPESFNPAPLRKT